MRLLRLSYCISQLLTVGWRLGLCGAHSTGTDREALLRGLLRRFPFWAYGHRVLSEGALEKNSVALAYSSALGYEQLSRGSAPDRARALALLGRCFLMRGESQRSLDYFTEAKKLGLDTPLLAEDTAAAHILQGNYAHAREILNQISAQAISAAGRAALAFVNGKLTTPPAPDGAPAPETQAPREF